MEDGLVTEFLTGVAGECFAGLAERGVLLPRADYPCAEAGDAFLEGVRTALAGGFSLLHSLFAVRARQVTGAASAADAAERLSGLLIGSDVAGALEILGLRGLRGVAAVIGSPDLARR